MPLKGMTVVLGALLFLALSAEARGETLPGFNESIIRPRIRLEAPPVSLKALDGTVKSLADYGGKAVVLNFWATWCEPCRVEMPAMERLWQSLQEKGLVVIAIAVDKGNPRRVKSFAEKYEITFPILLDPGGEVRKSYEVVVLPTSYVIGPDGRFIGKIVGQRDWDEDEAMSFFEELLKSGAP